MAKIHLIGTCNDVFKNNLEGRLLTETDPDFFKADVRMMRFLNGKKIDVLFIRSDNFPLTRRYCNKYHISLVEMPFDEPEKTSEVIEGYSRQYPFVQGVYFGKKSMIQSLRQILGQYFEIETHDLRQT